MSGEPRPGYGPRRGRNAQQTQARKREWWHYLVGAGILIALVGLIWGAYAIWFTLTHVRTSYARVSAFVVSLAAKTDTRVQRIPVKTGDLVKKGQIVAILDKADLEAQVEQARAALEAAKTSLSRAETQLEMTKRQTASSIAQAEAELAAARAALAKSKAQLEMDTQQYRSEVRKAQAELDRLKAGPRPQEIAQARAAVQAAESELARATATLQRMQRLQQQGAGSAQALDQALSDKQVAEANLMSAREKLSLLQEGSRPEDIAAAEAALALAKAKSYEGQMMRQEIVTQEAQVRRAEAMLQAALSQKKQVALKEQDVLAQRAAVAQAQAELEAAKSRLADAVLRSTTNGVVVRGPGRIVHEGEVVSKGEPIVTIASTDRPLWISGGVTELVVAKLKPGQSVMIRLDAFPRRKFKGKLIQVGKATASSPGASSPWQLQQIPLKISLDAKDPRIIPGMTCRAWIDIRK